METKQLASSVCNQWSAEKTHLPPNAATGLTQDCRATQPSAEDGAHETTIRGCDGSETTMRRA